MAAMQRVSSSCGLMWSTFADMGVHDFYRQGEPVIAEMPRLLQRLLVDGCGESDGG